MMRFFFHFRAGRRGSYRPVMVLGVLALGVLAGYLGRNNFLPRASADPPKAKPGAPPAADTSSDYSRRVVAYIYGSIPITREELGEYLIAREGAAKLELLVNKRIIEMACKERNIDVTAAEVDAALADDVQNIGVNLHDFVDKVLKHYNKTLFEWKEDVIRPKLLLTKLCRDRVHVTEDELKMAFDAYYGEKVDCQIILFPKGETGMAMAVHAKVRNDEKEWARQVSQQASQQLAAMNGHIRPIGHHTTGNDELEKQAFSLQPGEISAVIETPEGPVILKCLKHLPPQTDKNLAAERPRLEKEVFDKKVQQMIPVVFKELRDKAQPNLILRSYTTEDDLVRDVRQKLAEDAPGGAKAPLQGN